MLARKLLIFKRERKKLNANKNNFEWRRHNES